MPTYGYLCRTCSHRFETWQKMTDEPLTVCPECGGHIRRVLYPAGVVFKGSGFYKTDHSNGASASTSEETKKTESGTTETTKSDSKSTESGTSSTPSSESKTPTETGSKVA